MTNCQFIKFMDQNFSQYLDFPLNLMMDFEQLAEVVTLEGPSGNHWLVRFSKMGGHAYFKEGWKEFVETHHVEEGDCLVFEYRGSSCFSVLIFDRSGCEREASYFVGIMNPVLRKGCHAEEKHEKQLLDVLNVSSPRLLRDDNSPLQLDSDDEKSSSFKAKLDNIRFRTRSSASSGKSNHRQTTGIKLKAKLRCLRSTKAIRAETPYFIKFLLPSYLTGKNIFMTFPCDFVLKHLHFRPQEISLRHEDKLWPVMYRFKVASNRDSGTGLSGKGWLKFVRDNELYEGDGCIFVLSESETDKVLLDVHIVRAEDQLNVV